MAALMLWNKEPSFNIGVKIAIKKLNHFDSLGINLNPAKLLQEGGTCTDTLVT
jgi:hypothetical protein